MDEKESYGLGGLARSFVKEFKFHDTPAQRMLRD